MSRHCDFCLRNIEDDKEAIRLSREYIVWRSESEKRGFDSVELCGLCGINVKDRINEEFDHQQSLLSDEKKSLIREGVF